MKHTEVEVKLHTFLPSALNERTWAVTSPLVINLLSKRYGVFRTGLKYEIPIPAAN
jgi:hypothetical protein